LANLKSSIKRARQEKKRRAHNRAKKSAVRTAMKKTHQAIEAGDKAQALTLLNKAQSLIGKLSKSSAINSKTASRLTSRLTLQVNKVS